MHAASPVPEPADEEPGPAPPPDPAREPAGRRSAAPQRGPLAGAPDRPDAAPRPAPRWAQLLTDWLAAWAALAVLVGLLVPALKELQPLVLPALFVMVASISLTLDARALRSAPRVPLVAVVAAGALLPLLAYGIGVALSLPTALLAGLVVWAAAPPELTTPVLTRVAGGDTALSAAVLVAAGVVSLAVAPLALWLLPGAGAAVMPLVWSLLLAVVLPMGLAVATRTRWPARVAPSDRFTPAVSAAMVLFVLAVVAAGSSALLQSDPRLVLRGAAAGSLVLALGLAAGWLLGRRASERRAAAFSLGIRDFAVAAALVLAAGLGATAAAVPAAIGLVEMVLGALLASLWARRPAGHP